MLPLTLALLVAAAPKVICQDPSPPRAGVPMVMTCAVEPAGATVAMVLYRRQRGLEAYEPEPGLRVGAGKFRFRVCGSALQPGPLQIYVEARDARDELVARSGDDFSPQLLSVAGETPSLPSPALESSEDPLAPIRAHQAELQAEAEASLRRAPGRLYLGMGAGYGYGFFPARRLDVRDDISIAANGGPSGSVVLTPEIGYQLTGRWALGLRGRWEWIGRSQGAGDDRAGSPPEQSWALLVRASRAFGSGRTQVVASAQMGGGDGFRVVVPPVPEQGLRHNDTVRGGPFLLGPGVNVVHHLSNHFALTMGLNALAGLPSFAAVFDLQGGVEIGL